jgi:molybdate transport system substrate-binding protein
MNISKHLLFFWLSWASPLWAADLTVSAAASLTQAFHEIGAQFEAQHPGTKLKFNFGASGALVQQIINGAPVDVFASADTDTMDKAVAKAVVNAADSKVFTSNRLVLVTPLQADLGLKQLSDLKKPAVKRFAMGVPASVPAGHYALGALDKAGLWNDLKDKVISTQRLTHGVSLALQPHLQKLRRYRRPLLRRLAKTEAQPWRISFIVFRAWAYNS